MARMILVPALALGAVLATNSMTLADDGPAKAGFGTTMTLGGQGTAAQAATEDTELACCWRRYCCGYRGYYGGYGGGFGYGYSGYYSSYYRPNYGGYYNNFYSYRPAYYAPRVTPYVTFGGFGGSYGLGSYGGGFYGIAGNSADQAAPVVVLANQVASNSSATPASGNFSGPFRYDGGPANPVPFPKPDANPSTQATPPATGLPVSLGKSKPASPYTYKAYGEK